MTAAFLVLMNHRNFVNGIVGLICLLISPFACLANQQLTIGQITTVYLNPKIPSGGWITHASWSTDVVGLTYFDAGTWGTGLKVNGYWSGTATLSCSYAYSYNGADGHIHVGSGNEYWYFTCKGYPVTINPKSVELEKGEAADLTISISGAAIGDIPPLWESSDRGVATVYSTGDYTATVQAKKSGWCTITCYSYMGEPVICDVHVKSFPPTGVSISPAQAEVMVGTTVKLTGKLSPSGASAKLTWKSENPSIATVQNGIVTGVSPGKTKINVSTDNGLSASSEITVISNEPTSISLSPEEVELTAGKSIKLNYTMYPQGASSTVTWESENPSIATVQNGTVTGVSGGKTRIKVKTANGLWDYSTINVIEYPRGPVSSSLSGNGTQESPYLINCAADLRYLSDVVNSGKSFEGQYFRQTANITINTAPYDSEEFKNQELWIPIGRTDYAFSGIYDGDNYTISGVYISETADIYGSFSAIGLFGSTHNATFKNIRIANVLIDFITKTNVGALVGSNSVNTEILIDNCHVYNGLVKSHNGGGLVGTCSSKDNAIIIISNCSNSVTIESDFRANGVIGRLLSDKGSIYNCINSGNVRGHSSASGIVGILYGSVYNCCNAGTLGSSGHDAGIVGQASPKKSSKGIYHCVSYGQLKETYSAAILYDNLTNSTSYNIEDNYYLSDYKCVYSTKNVYRYHNHALSSQELKSHETLQNLNSTTNNLYCKWVAGKDGYPILDFYSDFLSGIQDIRINDSINLDIDYNKPLTVFNLNGIRVSDAIDNLASGFYIVQQGAIVRKLVIK